MRERLPELDGIRGIAIGMVLIHHYFADSSLVSAGPSWFAGWARKLLCLTWSGVDLFFVLSGFLIAGILVDNRGAAHYFKAFYTRRACRILPLYYCVIAFLALVRDLPVFLAPQFDWLFNGSIPLWSYGLFTQNIYAAMIGNIGANWLAPTWSLAVEEQFYLVFPLIVCCVPRKRLPLLLLFALVAAPTLRYIYVDYPFTLTFVNAPWRADSLALGALLALGIRSDAFKGYLKANKRAFGILLSVLMAGEILASLGVLRLGLVFLPSWLALLYGGIILVPFVYGDFWGTRLLRIGLLTRLGLISYAVYLLHLPVAGLMHGLLLGQAPTLNTWSDAAVMMLSLGVTLCVATLSYVIMEKRLIDWGHQCRYDAAPTPNHGHGY
jgi:peptidoglycan/LPS O-acetylase OafA/YrhL